MFRAALIATALTASSANAAAPKYAESVPSIEFSRTPARGMSNVAVYIGIAEYGADNSVVYWAERAGTMVDGHTDTNRCPALKSVIDSLDDLTAPSLAAPTAMIIIGDGTGYSLTVRSSTLDSTTVTGGRLADWINNALVKLEDCWSSD